MMWLKHIKFTVLCILLGLITLLTVPVILISGKHSLSSYWNDVKELFSEVKKETYFD